MSTSTAVSWLKRDVLLFAHSIGCKADELQFLYELHPDFQVFPTYPVILSFKDSTQEVIPYNTTLPHPPVPEMSSRPPSLDPSKVVDGIRHLKIHKTLPTSTEGRQFSMRKSIVGIYDKGSGTIVHSRHELIDESKGECCAEVDAQSFYVGQGGWGGPRGPKGADLETPKRKPDFVVTEKTSEEVSLLYRLNGDYNPLHATPEPGRDMGFPGVILHGLGTWNICAHAVVRSIGGGDGGTLKEFQARFASPVLPGDTLVVEIWNAGLIDEKEGLVDVRFLCRVEGGKVVLKAGQAILKMEKSKSKL